MKKLPLFIDEKSESRSDELPNLKRAYSSMIIKPFGFYPGQLLKNLAIFTPSTLELNALQLTDDSLAQFLDSNGQLDKLVMTDCYKPRFDNLSSLKSLKSLSIAECSWIILKMFPMCNNIQELKINAPSKSMLDLENDGNYLTGLMAGQKELETLIITTYFPLNENEVVDAKYNLKELSVRQDDKLKGIQPNINLHQILERHKGTLENLEICVHVSNNFMAYIMKNLKIQRLFIISALVSKNLEIFEEMKPNFHLKKLIIGRTIQSAEPLQVVLKSYPAIESLIIKTWQPCVINEALTAIASNLKSLTFLHIPSLTYNTPDAPMPSLKAFNINRIDRMEHFLAFCSNIPSIEHLAIKQFNVGTLAIRHPTTNHAFENLPFILTTFDIGHTEHIQIMTSKLSQLKHIKFGQAFELTSQILDVFSANCPKLRFIEMPNHFYEPKSNVTHGNIQVVYFSLRTASHVFKQEKTLWDKNEDGWLWV